MRYTLFVLLFFVAVAANAQSRQIQSGDEAFQNMQYIEAVEEYEKALSKANPSTALSIHHKLARTWLIINQPAEAIRHLEILVDSDWIDQYPSLYLDYANALRSIGEFEDAIDYYKKHLEKSDDDEYALAGIKSCRMMLGGSYEEAPYIVKNAVFLNSPYDDFAPFYSDRYLKELTFASNRPDATGKEIDNWTGEKFSDLFKTERNRRGEWSPPVPVGRGDNVNTGANEGVACVDNRARTLYFTRCENRADENIHCAIYQASRSGSGWSRTRVVLMDPESNIGHPAVTSDEKIIIFASDLEGGKGGKDLWMASRKSKYSDFGEFKNLGDVINSEKDDMFPVLLNDTTLYFASNGHPGYGGFDLFISYLKDGQWSKPENILPPFNSNRDDFGITFYKNKRKGLFTSNRDGGSGGDDIYTFVRKKMHTSVDGIVFNEETGESLAGSDIVLNEEGKAIATSESDQEGRFELDTSNFKEEKNYEILASKDDFFSGKKQLGTFDLEKDQHLHCEIYLKPIPKKPVVLPEILYDLDQYEIKPQFEDSLMVLVRILNDNPRLVVELASHTDSRHTEEYNMTLSQNRAQAVVEFLIEKGIDSARMVAKGYGESKPRKIEHKITRNGITFEEGIILTEDYIAALSDEEAKETAHQLNRRTEFEILSKDYQPLEKPVTERNVRKEIPLTPCCGDKYSVECNINGMTVECVVNPKSPKSCISNDLVKKLLKDGKLKVDDFEGEPAEVFANRMIRDENPVNIRELALGEVVLNNIVLLHDKQEESEVLIGSDLSGKIEIDEENMKLIIYE